MALAYLLSPTFEFVNTAGKPLTGGWLEVYIAGSREKYYCASDFSGTLHPFRIPLDSLGANVVLAEEGNSYDVYAYNRYGGLLMSRYNVKPGEGGGISGDSITSTDGSIIVTQTGDGVDLRVNAKPPTVMRCTASDLTGDGAFQFSELQRDGTSARVDSYTVKIDEGWWHFDAVARLRWSGEANGTQSVSLYTANGSDSLTFDMSYPHSETVNISGELKAEQDGTSFVLGVLGVPVGMTVSLVDFGIHSIVGEGASNAYTGGTGIVIDNTERIISIDPEVVQGKLTAGTGIDITNDVVSVDTTVIATQADLATKQDVISDLSDIRDGAALGATAVQDPNYVHTDENFTSAEKTKLSGIEAGAEVNVQSNWAETDTSADSYIQNKPTIDQTYNASSANAQSGTAVAEAIATVNQVPASTSADADKVLTVDSNGDPAWADAQAPISAGDGIDITNDVVSAKVDGSTVVFNASGQLSATAVVPPLKALVAGSNITITENTTDVVIAATVPSVPVTDVTVGGTSVVNAQGVAEVPRQVNADWNSSAGASEILNKPVLATVATTGAYSDLSGTPTIPTATSDLTNDSGFITLSDVPAQVNADWDATSGAGEILNKPVLATVATTGAYSDLSGTPAIPTATSDLTNDSGFITLSDVPAQVNADWNATSGVAQILNKPVIPEGVPSYSSTDEGKVLGVVESGGSPTLEWVQSAGTVTDVEVNGSSVVNASGVAEVVVPAQVQSDWNATSGLGEILNKPSLATVATTGDYSDLSNTPAIPVIGTITV